jgi:hypothetical protein
MRCIKKIVYLFSAILILSQLSCSPKKDELGQLWFYTHTSPGSDDDEQPGNITPASFLDLQPDGKYTRDFGEFDHGDWEKKDSILILKNAKGKIFAFPIRDLYRNELQLVSGRATVLNFEGQQRDFSSKDQNPFSMPNNKWRIPATQKETEIEIKQRLKNHFRFNELYFQWALDNEFQSIDVRSTPSLLTIYGNGFALKDTAELPAAWRSYFYDEEDCNRANEITKEIFDKNDISWVRTDNKFKMFVSAFQQLQQQVK